MEVMETQVVIFWGNGGVNLGCFVCFVLDTERAPQILGGLTYTVNTTEGVDSKT